MTEETEAAAPAKMARLSDLTGGMGHKLEEIKGVEVVVAAIDFDNRPVHKLDDKGKTLDELEDKDVAIITLDDDRKFYTFSVPLIDKLREVDQSALPVLAKFDIKDIAGGRRVWTID